VALGVNALNTNTIGNNNVAMGYGALSVNTTATHNVAVGTTALNSNTTGGGNTGIGTASCDKITTGSYNTGIGFNSGPDSVNAGFINSISIGAFSTPLSNHHIQLGGQYLSASLNIYWPRVTIGNPSNYAYALGIGNAYTNGVAENNAAIYLENCNNTPPAVGASGAILYSTGGILTTNNFNVLGVLSITGSANYTYSYSYLANVVPPTGASSGTNPYSVVASQRMAVSEFDA
jgi:hypothetical protein